MNIPVAFYDTHDDPISTSFVKQSSDSFYRVSSFKFSVIQTILRLGVNVLYSDSDIIIYHNPIPVIQSTPFNSSIFQKDMTICTGFFYMEPTPLSFDLMKRALVYIQKKHKTDQGSLIRTFKDLKLTASILPSNLFQSGSVFFRRHQYWWDPIDPSIVMMHNNYILGSVCKQYRMLEMNYTSHRTKDPEDTRYLTAESLPFNAIPLQKELTLLASIANRLNRVLIVPPIPCSIGKGFCTIANRYKFGCFAEVIEGVKAGYRESVEMERFVDV